MVAVVRRDYLHRMPIALRVIRLATVVWDSNCLGGGQGADSAPSVPTLWPLLFTFFCFGIAEMAGPFVCCGLETRHLGGECLKYNRSFGSLLKRKRISWKEDVVIPGFKGKLNRFSYADCWQLEAVGRCLQFPVWCLFVLPSSDKVPLTVNDAHTPYKSTVWDSSMFTLK